MSAGQDRSQQHRHELRSIAAITVEEHDDLAIARRARTGCAGTAIAAYPLYDDARARSAGPLDGAILAATIDHDYLIDRVRRDGADNLTDRPFLIERRNHQRDTRTRRYRGLFGLCWCSCRHHRLQRRPQCAQVEGGWSLSSARRKS